MSRLSFNTARDTVRGPGVVVIAGTAGGLAEVLWVAASAAQFDVDAARVAGEVAATVLPVLPVSAVAPALGLFVHFVLSLALAAVFGFVLERVGPQAGPVAQVAAALTLLTVVWAVNFLVLLPWLNPVLTTLLPPGVTFTSKLLFALAMAGTFALRWAPRADAVRVNRSNRMVCSPDAVPGRSPAGGDQR